MSEYWFEKLISINFNFEAKQDNWTVRCLEIKEILKNMDTISIELLGGNYHWLARQKKSYDDGELSQRQVTMVTSLNLDRFFESWGSKFERVKEWVAVNGKMPTNTTQKDFASWLFSQRAVFKNGNLSVEQIQKLESIGLDLSVKGNEKRIEIWNQKYEQLKEFLRSNALKNLNSSTPLYRWLWSQNTQFECGNYDTNRVNSLLELGIDIRKRDSVNGGRTRTNSKWLSNMQ